MRRSRKRIIICPRTGNGNGHASIGSRVTGKCAHVYGIVSDDSFNMICVRRATYLAVSSYHCCWKCWGVVSVELRNPQAVLGRLGSGRSNVAVIRSHSPAGMIPLEVNLAFWVVKRSGLVWSDGWLAVFAAKGGIQANRAVDLTGD